MKCKNHSKRNNGSSSSYSIRKKRADSYWEPLYNPDFNGITHAFSWCTSETTGVKNALCSSEKLYEGADENESQLRPVKNFRFISCDFIGNFKPGLSFSNCDFEFCDLGLSTWSGVKFSNCNFINCSFTMAIFDRCNFLDCKWKSTGISGTETKIYNTVITNPDLFISSAYTNEDREVLKQKGRTTPEYQVLRLEETKVKLARVVLSNNEKNAEDSVYYESVKVYLLQSIKYKRQKAIFNLHKNNKILRSIFSFIFCFIEKVLIYCSGSMNGWGGNVVRAALIGLSLVILFSCVYTFKCFDWLDPLAWRLALIKSFDISLLVGYTKHATKGLTWQEQGLYSVNAVFGLWWYAIFVPTVINRICRVR